MARNGAGISSTILQQELESFGLEYDDDGVPERMLELCVTHRLTEGTLVDEWVAFSTGKPLPLTVDNLNLLEHEILAKMLKRKSLLSKGGSTDSDLPKKKCCLTFKEDWLNEIVQTESPKSQKSQRLRLGEIFKYNADVGLICSICAEAKASCDFSAGKKWDGSWKLDYLKRHLLSKVHDSAVVSLRDQKASDKSAFGIHSMFMQTPAERANRQTLAKRQRYKPEEVKVLIDNVLLAVKLNASMLSVREIHEHLAHYTKVPDSWRSQNYAVEFLESISSVIQLQVMGEVRNSLFHTLIVDESTDISVSKMLVIYLKYRSPATTLHKTVFGGIVELSSCDADAITTAIITFYTANNLSLQRMVMFTSDGASVMLGKNNGVAAKLRETIPHLLEQHCVAHREDLSIDDAWKKVKMIKEIETLLRTVYSVFCRYSIKKAKLEEMASIIERDVLSCRPVNEVRWLSRHFAVNALMRNYEVLLKYFDQEITKENEPTAKYCYKKLSDPTYHISLAVLNDVLSDLAELPKLFQRSSLTTIEAMHFARGKIKQIKGQYLGTTVFWSSAVKSLITAYSDTDKDFDTSSILCFISMLCDHMEKRFPRNELKEWASFDFGSLTTQQCSYEYGTANIGPLVERYKELFVFDNSANSNTSLQIDNIVGQYNTFKYVVAENSMYGSLKTFQDLVNFTLKNADQYPVVAQLIDICATFQASSADCEQGFSLMNNIKTRSMNCLEEGHLDMLMRTKSFLLNGKINLDDVYLHWKGAIDRREKRMAQSESEEDIPMQT